MSKGNKNFGMRFSIVEKNDKSQIAFLWNGLCTGLFAASLCVALCLLCGLSCGAYIALFCVTSGLCVSFVGSATHGKMPLWLPFAIYVIAGILLFRRGVSEGLKLAFNGLMDAVGEKLGQITPKLTTDPDVGGMTFALVFAGVCLFIMFSFPTRVRYAVSGFFCIVFVLTLTFLNKTVMIVPILMLLSLMSALMPELLSEPSGLLRFFKALIPFAVGTALVSSAFFAAASLPAAKISDSFIRRTAAALSSGVMPQGDIKSGGAFEPSSQPALKVLMSESHSCYLRGYVGEKFTEDRWSSLDPKEKYKSADLFYWLHESGFYSQSELGTVAAKREADSADNGTVTVYNVGASRRYTYSPYGVITASEEILKENSIGDVCFGGGLVSPRSYRFTTVTGIERTYPKLAGIQDNGTYQMPDSYKDAAAHYADYAYDNYLYISADDRKILEDLLGNGGDGAEPLKSAEKTVEYLLSSCTYSTEGCPVESSFTEDFLIRKRSGSSVDFATAAALIMRFYGVPSRYVEGYAITTEDASGVRDGEELTVYETGAHAWAEYYISGVGWVPLETTPPYVDIMESPVGVSGSGAEIEPDSEDSGTQPDTDSSNSGDSVDASLQIDKSTLLAVIAAASVLILALIAGASASYFYRKAKRKAFAATFTGADRVIAVKNLYYDTVRLLSDYKVASGQMYPSVQNIEDRFGQDYAKLFSVGLAVYEKAAFGNGAVTEEERTTELELHKYTVDLCPRRKKR